MFCLSRRCLYVFIVFSRVANHFGFDTVGSMADIGIEHLVGTGWSVFWLVFPGGMLYLVLYPLVWAEPMTLTVSVAYLDSIIFEVPKNFIKKYHVPAIPTYSSIFVSLMLIALYDVAIGIIFDVSRNVPFFYYTF